MKKKTLTYIILALLLLLGVSVFWNYKQYRDLQAQPDVITDVTVVEYRDIRDSVPKPIDEKVVGKVKVRIPQTFKDSEKCSEKAVFCADSSEIRSESSEICSDSIGNYIEVDRVQKVYEDSAYTAYVSGYEPSLDSIVVRQKEVLRTITETRTVTKKEYRRLNVGLQVGYGYGFNSRDFQPFVGIGVTYNIFK